MRRSLLSFRSLSFLVLALAVTVAGCGVPEEEQATTVDPENVPFGLLDDEPRPPPQAALPPSGPGAELYFVAEGTERLAVVERQLDRADPSDVVAALLEGPSEEEASRGLTTALADDDAVQSVKLTGGVADVDLAPGFADLDGASQRMALAQLVYTLTARPGIGRVSFSLDGQPVEIPRGDGTLTTGSVSRDSYRELAPSA